MYRFIYISSLFVSISCEFYSLHTNGTTVIGRIMYTVFENRPYVAFWKLPYAEAPVDGLRFKPPKPKPWPEKSICNYSIPYEETCSTATNENCLFLSIYKPLSTKINFAVMVWIHEHSNLHGPDFLIDEGVIVIAVSFRIGIFGFLNTGDEFARGNMGAKDMLAALRWIRDNISYFSGDVNKVTVIGSGRAASSVASFLLSPAAEDLYTRLIVQSDASLSPALYKNYNFEISNKLYWNLNGPFNKFNRTELYEILRNSSARRLSSVSTNLFDSSEVRDDQRLITAFGPTVESSSKGAFMNKLPLDVYKRKLCNNNAGVLIGYTSLESLHKLSGFVHNRKLLTYLNYNFQYLLPFEGRKDIYGSRRYREIRRKIMDFYFVNGTIGERSLRRYAKYVSDQVIYPILRQAILQAEASCNKIYLYRFSRRGLLNAVWHSSLRNLNLTGATAGDEICYQFRCKTLGDVYKNDNGANDKLFVKKVARLLANFAKFGDPTPRNDQLLRIKWEPLVGDTCIRAMNFGKKIKMVDVPERKRMEFWDALKREYFDGN
ncbi:hypothetical protein O3G_MSEX007303 [Manduca sexta]|uniref:Carboxylesterase type B domain-containing protein n=1 Tax=Manduca sexta TaxID=7130 RepID=A0A921Z5M6_MANSE|nr:hypothetical protein O3G_MSEX007303 [Manduca sexta]KAG6451695.1 hypothetical protein O3G_MSEX007303 [Manduca sexta]